MEPTNFYQTCLYEMSGWALAKTKSMFDIDLRTWLHWKKSDPNQRKATIIHCKQNNTIGGIMTIM